MIYFIYHLIQGERGLLSWMRLKQKVVVAEKELNTLKETAEVLERQVKLLRPDNLDPDMLDERARKILNSGHEDEIIIPENSLSK